MKRKLIVVDVETAGLDPAQHSILSLAAVVYQDGGICGEFHTLIAENPLCLDSVEGAERVVGEPSTFIINGIGLHDLLEAPAPWQVVQKFKNWLLANELYGKQTLVAHNASFDSGFLRRLWRLAGADYEQDWSHRMLCTQTAALLLEQAGRISLPGGSASLDSVIAALGLPPRTGKHHEALEDAKLCARVLAKVVDRVR